MSDTKQVPKIIIAPEVLEHLQQTLEPDELQQILDEFKKMVEEGTLLDNSTAVDMDELERDDPELFAEIQQALELVETSTKPTMQ